MTATAAEVSNFWSHHEKGEKVGALLCLRTYPELVELECSELLTSNNGISGEHGIAPSVPQQEAAYAGELAVQAS